MPRRQLPPRLPLILALAWLALDPTPRAAEAQGLYSVNPGSPLEVGLVQRLFIGPNFTDAFAGSLLPVSWHAEQWTRFSFPYGLEPFSRGDSTGTEGTLFGGGRALAGGRFRHADRVGGGALFEATGHYLRGTDWPFVDPVEKRLRESSAFLPARADRLERWGAGIRYDRRPDDPDGWVFEGGLDRLRWQPAHRARRRPCRQLDPLARTGTLPPGPPVGRRPGARARGRRGRVLPHRPGHRGPVALLRRPNRALHPARRPGTSFCTGRTSATRAPSRTERSRGSTRTPTKSWSPGVTSTPPPASPIGCIWPGHCSSSGTPASAASPSPRPQA